MKIIDLSHNLYQGMPHYPTDPPISIIKKKHLKTDNSILHQISFGTHSGTHLDVPMHTIKRGKGLSDYGLEAFFGRAIKINNKLENYNYIEDSSIDVIIYETGWYKNYLNPKVYYGNSRPEISYNILQNCLDNGIKIFGCDLPSVDKSGSKEKNNHKILLENDIIIYESLTNLDKIISNKPFKFYGFPLPLDNVDGCPVRAVAILDED